MIKRNTAINPTVRDILNFILRQRDALQLCSARIRMPVITEAVTTKKYESFKYKAVSPRLRRDDGITDSAPLTAKRGRKNRSDIQRSESPKTISL